MKRILSQLGLSEKESSVYEALMTLGRATVSEIASRAVIKRPTTYLVLESLSQKGLVSAIPDSKRTLYVAAHPETLMRDITKKSELLKRYLPDLLAQYNSQNSRPEAVVHFGKEGILKVYEEIYKSGRVDFFATLGELENFLPSVTKNISGLAKQGKLIVREILSGSQQDLKYAQNIKQGEYYQIRLAQKNLPFLTDNAIYGNSCAFFSFKRNPFAVVINSTEISGSLRSLFQLAWASAEIFKTKT